MSTTKRSTKKTVTFLQNENDQNLLNTVNTALEGEQFSSFNELCKTALQHFFETDTERLAVLDTHLVELLSQQKELKVDLSLQADGLISQVENLLAQERQQQLHKSDLTAQTEELISQFEHLLAQERQQQMSEEEAEVPVAPIESADAIAQLAPFLEDF